MAESFKRTSKTLKQVLEMVPFIHRLATKEALRKIRKSSDRAYSLYSIIVHSQLDGWSDKELMKKASMDEKAYRRALSELKGTLLDAFLDLDLRQGGYPEVAIRTYRMTHAQGKVEVLTRLGLRFSAYIEAEKLFNEAKELEQWRSALQLLPGLLSAASIFGQEKRYRIFEHESIKLKELVEAESAAKKVSDEINFVYSKSEGGHPELRPIIDRATRKLQIAIERYGTFRLRYLELELRGYAGFVDMDNQQSLSIEYEKRSLFDEYPFFAPRMGMIENIIELLDALIRLKKLEEAQDLVSKSKHLFFVEMHEWFSFQDAQFRIMMLSQHYEAAYELTEEIFRAQGFESQIPSDMDRWKINRVFAEVFAGRGVPFRIPRTNEKPGDLAKSLLRHFPSYQKDHTGHYMSAIVLEILILLERKRGHLFLLDRIDSLHKFKNRYLKKHAAFQSICFVEMMQLVVKYDFKRASVVQAAEPIFRRMVESTSKDPVMHALLLPYETLWQAIVERLPEEAWVLQ